MKLKNIGPEELDLLKQVLRNIQIARRANSHIVFRLLISGSYFEESVVNPFKKMINWTEDDEKNVMEIAEKLELAAKNGKTLKEKNERLKKELKVRGLTIKDRIRHIIKKPRSK